MTVLTLVVVGEDSFDIVCLNVVVPAFIPFIGGVTVSELGIEFVVDVLSSCSTLSVTVVFSVMDKLECSIEIGFVEESFVTVSILIAVVFSKITVYYYLVM